MPTIITKHEKLDKILETENGFIDERQVNEVVIEHSSDEEDDPKSIFKKFESLLKSGLSVPLYLQKFVPANSSYLNYVLVYTNYLMPALITFEGLWSFRKAYRLLKNIVLGNEEDQKLVKGLFHATKIAQFWLGIAYLSGAALTLLTLSITAIISSSITILKASLLLHTTQVKIDKRMAEIENEHKAAKTPAQIIDIQNNDFEIKKLLIKKKFQIRSLRRACVLLLASSVAMAGLLMPGIGLVSFVLVTLVTVHAIRDIQKKKDEKKQLHQSYESVRFFSPPPRVNSNTAQPLEAIPRSRLASVSG